MSVATIELGRVCRLDRRVTAASEALSKGLEFVGMEHVDPESGRIVLGQGSRTGEGKGQAFLFDDRHVLFGKLRPYLRKIALPGQSGCASTELVPLLPDAARLDRGYLFHWVRRQHVIDALMAKNTGARMPRADMSVLLDMAIPLPPLDEQRRIVGLLDRAAEIRRRADAARAKARAIIPALFLDTFGDPATNPKGWPLVEFGKVIKVRSGNFLPAKSMAVGGIFPVYGGNGINGVHSEFMFEDRKIVIGRVGAYCGNVHLSEPRSWITDNALYVSDYPSYFSQPYLVQALENAKLNERSSQAGQPLISAGRIATVPLLAPPLPLQTAFAEQAQRLEAIARALDTAAAKAEAIAAGLSAEIFGPPSLETDFTQPSESVMETVSL